MLAKGIYGFNFRKDMMPVSVASVNTKTGIIDINETVWNTLPANVKFFVLLHEYAHIEYQTTSELKADEMALMLFEKQGYTEREAINTLISLLPFTTYEHFKRVSNLERISLSDDNQIT
ncbi:hypothetical protein [Emticicia sp. W12TSBA100-4]|uniref:hypothetical protein n=1 Tax=Emticicia sp. W12TSBA100-4 TaxID=3160965 RepID=UPI00330590BA